MSNASLSVSYQNAMGQITEHPDGYVLVHYYKSKWSIKELRALLERLGTILLLRGWQRILIDMRHIEPLTATEKAFLIEEWYSGKIARPTSLSTCYVLAENALARLSVHEMQEIARRQHRSFAFQSLEEAQAYVLTLTE
jgi:hypothetical protein